jgi:hypothetical protein
VPVLLLLPQQQHVIQSPSREAISSLIGLAAIVIQLLQKDIICSLKNRITAADRQLSNSAHSFWQGDRITLFYDLLHPLNHQSACAIDTLSVLLAQIVIFVYLPERANAEDTIAEIPKVPHLLKRKCARPAQGSVRGQRQSLGT